MRRGRGNHVRPASMPSTILSETARSTVFTESLTVSVAVFLATKEVEKARGAKLTVRAERKDVRARNDIVIE